MSAEPELAEGTIFGKYRLVKLLGRGGMGAVYEAQHVDLKKRVAIKVLPRAVANDPVVRARFEREGEIASRIRHPHVVDVTDVGTEDGIPYLVMEFLEGEDLGTLLDHTRPLPVERLCEIILPVCAAVGAAHDEGIIHRDLKPENIYLAHAKHGIIPKLLDFGISKVAAALAGSNDLTKTSSLLGTPYYMSPEQVRGAKHIDTRTDVYALGVILYECATGNRPFAEDNLYNLLLEIVGAEVVKPRHHNPELPEAFEDVIMKAIARPLDVRYANVYQLGQALLPFADATTRGVWQSNFDDPPAGVISAENRSETELAVAEPSSPSQPGTKETPLAVQEPPKKAETPPRARTISASISEVAPARPAPVSAPPPKSRTPIVIGVGIAAAALIGYVALKKPDAQPTPAAANSAQPPPPPPVSNSTGFSAVKHAQLEVKAPPGSVVKVNNETRALTGEKLALEGPLETAFYVTVEDSSGKILITQKVYMAEGFTVPASIDARVVPAASASAPTPKSDPKQKPAPSATEAPKAAPTKSAPAPGATNWDG
ncbi:MAG: protein kinase domain-containing protein [Polyangiales bacterium]